MLMGKALKQIDCYFCNIVSLINDLYRKLERYFVLQDVIASTTVVRSFQYCKF
jgi:hypothetical protein